MNTLTNPVHRLILLLLAISLVLSLFAPALPLLAADGTLDHIGVTPSVVDVRVGATQQFAAQGYDADNNPVSGPSFTWSTDVGSIDESGLFTALEAAGVSGYVRATSNSIYGEVTVNIVAQALDHIGVTPSVVDVRVGATQQFAAQGYDADNNPVSGLSFTWSTDVGSIDESGLFTAQATAGVTGYVRATTGPIYREATINIGPTISASSISYGETIQSSIDVPGEWDSYTFAGSAGDIPLIRMGFANYEPQVRLYGPGGTLLWYASGGIASNLAEISSWYIPDMSGWTLPSDGTYTILAGHYKGTATGEYSLHLQRLNDPANATAISYGDTVPATIDARAEMDAYTFAGSTSDVVLVRMDFTSYNPEVRLYGPDDTLLWWASGGIASKRAEISIYSLPSDGTYTILAGHYKGTATGEYTLHVRWLGVALFEDTTWSPGDGHIVVDGLVVVEKDVTLTIEAGTIIKFPDSYGGIVVRGALNVMGTVEQPVILTSLLDDTAGGDTNGDGAATTAIAGDWYGIGFSSSTAVGTLQNFQVRYAEKAISGDAEGASASVHNAILRDGHYGIYVYTPYVEIEAENCLIVDNAYTGVFVRADSRELLRNCTIVGNGFEGSGWTAAGIHLGGSILTVENTIVAFNSNGLHHSGDPPAVTVRNSDFYNPDGQEIIWDGDPGMPDLDQDGNITTDPLFVDREAGNYELNAGSPAVDCGRGIGALSEDILGRSRYDDQGMPNIGTGYPSYVDMGAYERQEDTMAGDLAVKYVSNPDPEFVGVGDSFTIEWTVANVGLLDCIGPWQDVVYLSADPYISTDDLVLETRVHDGTLAPRASYSETIITTAPDTPVPKYIVVHTNADGTLPEAVETNNVGVSSHALAVDIPLLELNVPVTGTLEPTEWNFYRFEGAPGHSVLFTLDAEAASGSTGLYLRYFTPPTVSEYDVAGTAYNQPDQEARLLEPLDGTYYVGVHGQHLLEGPIGYTIFAELPDLDIREVSPNEVGNLGRATVKIVGDNFSPEAQVELVAPDGTIIEGEEDYQDAATLFATFDLLSAGVSPGEYDVVVTNPGPESVTEYDVLTMTSGAAPAFEANLIVQGIARPGRVIQVRIEYANIGDTNLPSPLLTIESDEDAAWRLPVLLTGDSFVFPGEWISGPTVSVLALSSDGPATILRPGQSDSVVVKARTPFREGDMPFTLYVLGAPGSSGLGEEIDWEQLGQDIRPPDTLSDAWDPLFERLQVQVGDTWGDYLAMLRDNAEHLTELGMRVYDAAELFSFEFLQASSMGSPPYLESAQDAFCPAPELPLSFERYFLPGPSYRAREGALGRGWTHSYEITLQQRSDGSVVVNGPGGFDRLFEADGDGGYVPSPGDYATLTKEPDDEFLLREKDGLQRHFRADGLFDYVQDTNGNRITAEYDTDGKIIQIASSSGDSFTFAYDASGRLVSLTDHASRITTYAYDDFGEHLLLVTRPDGEVISYTYVQGEGLLRDHLLGSVSRPGDVQVSFSYDSLGRLVEQHIGADEESVQYSYSSAGKTNIADAFGNTTTFWLDSRGRTARIQNALGVVADMIYDATGNLASVVGPAGVAPLFAYDTLGNLTSAKDPIGYVTSFGYGGEYNRLLWAQDARGNLTSRDYDGKGNLVSIAYPDGTAEYFAYDASGNVLTWTKRRGDTVTYDYNTAGQMTSKNYPDTAGIDYTYQYDNAGNLVSATDPSGTTLMTYDSDTDWLTQIEYPGGQSFTFEYNNVGQRTRRTDQDGMVVNYIYDEAGRLDQMTDATDALIVDYDYDTAGWLLRKTLGNGVYTTYDYDGAGRLLHLVNHNSDDTGLSRFDYTYDASSQRTSMTTLDGTFTYAYDPLGQLVSVMHLDGHVVEYVYDAVGNRVEVIDDSMATAYTTNGMNQYTDVGSVTHTYDDNGNMTSKTEGGVTTTYTYNIENHLVGVATPTDTWTYTYDAFGNRVASTHNGVATSYIVDPIGLGNVAAEYDSSGTLVARYEHGYGLLARTDSGDTSAFYTFDAIGSTSELTAADGSPANGYKYDPFGILLDVSESLPNPFQYVGEYGVMNDKNGLHHMRMRFYDTDIGRFTSEDPLGISGGYANLNNSVDNNPVTVVDPTGLISLRRIGCAAAYPVLWRIRVLEYFNPWSIIVGHGQYWGYMRDATKDGSTAAPDHPYQGIAWHHDWDLVGFRSWDPREHEGVEAHLKLLRAFNRAVLYEASHSVTVDWVIEAMQEAWENVKYIYTWQMTMLARLSFSRTPEDKFGPAGYDAPDTPEGSEVRYIPAGQTMYYLVEFWNKPDALVPTQDAVIRDTLDPAIFDLSTLEFTRIGFLKWDVPLLGGQVIDTRVDLRPDMNIAVDVTATFNPDTGEIEWWFHCVDPMTGEYPEDPMAGFLPPFNEETGFEIGWVEFQVRPKGDLPSGTQITNQAFVEFDFAGDIWDHPAPKEGPWVNTIDAEPPASEVADLPAEVDSLSFLVSWSGEDDAAGSGIADYDIYVSDNGEAFLPWLQNTALTEDTFTGQPSHIYAFYSIARDNVGNFEDVPAEADATTTVIAAPPVTVDISVVLQGGSRPDEGWVVPITVRFFSPEADVLNDTPIQQFDHTTIKSNGTAVAQCFGITPGTYDITVVSEHTLMNVRRGVVVTAPSTAVAMGTLLEGNAHGDNIINITDFGILSVAFMKTCGEEGYDPRADFDRNCIINISDFGLLSVNFMRTSPIELP